MFLRLDKKTRTRLKICQRIKLLAIDSLGEKISNNLQSGKQPLFGVAFPFMWPFSDSYFQFVTISSP